MFACDNCTPGQAGHWYVALVGIILLAGFALLVVVLWSRHFGWTAASCVAAAALVLAAAGAVSAGLPITADGAECGSAISASREVPGDQTQLACKQNAVAAVHTGQFLIVAAGIAMTVAVALSIIRIVLSIIRPRRSPDRLTDATPSA
jgi:hypothetical protein